MLTFISKNNSDAIESKRSRTVAIMATLNRHNGPATNRNWRWAVYDRFYNSIKHYFMLCPQYLIHPIHERKLASAMVQYPALFVVFIAFIIAEQRMTVPTIWPTVTVDFASFTAWQPLLQEGRLRVFQRPMSIAWAWWDSAMLNGVPHWCRTNARNYNATLQLSCLLIQ